MRYTIVDRKYGQRFVVSPDISPFAGAGLKKGNVPAKGCFTDQYLTGCGTFAQMRRDVGGVAHHLEFTADDVAAAHQHDPCVNA